MRVIELSGIFCFVMDRTIKTSFSSFCIIFWVISLTSAHAQSPGEIIELKVKKFPFVPTEFYIKEVVDNRKNNEAIGSIIISTDTPLKKLQIDMKGGADKTVSDFISKSLARDLNLRPITLTINQLRITETPLPGGRISGNLDFTVSFGIAGSDEPVKLIDHKGGASYTRSVNQHALIESVISASVINAVRYFNKWINQEAGRNEKLARSLELTFTDVRNDPKSDTLFYEPGQPLSFADFKSKPDVRSRFAAEIFPFLAFEESYKVVKGVIKIEIKLKVYLVRSFSWVKDYAMTQRTLNHEQRHFDIVKLSAERFKKRIKDEDINVDNYQGILSVEYLETLREMNRIQVQYDTETSHGSNEATQRKWDELIDKELKS